MSESEVARLRNQIISEYEATQRVFTGFSVVSRHDFIQKRQENIEHCYEELKKHLPPEQAILVVLQAEVSVFGGDGISSDTTS